MAGRTLILTAGILAPMMLLSACDVETPEQEGEEGDVGLVDEALVETHDVEGVEVEGPYYTYYLGFRYLFGDREIGDCSSLFQMTFYKPAGPGPFPLFMYQVGTSSDPNAEYVHGDILKQMAARGFVAVSVSYDNYDLFTYSCPWYDRKASCIYDEGFWASGVSILDWLPYVDTSRIVTGGNSQGGHIAILAGDFSSHILAAHPTGVTTLAPSSRSSCLEGFALPRDRIRLGNGEHEDRHGCSWPGFGCYFELLECNRPLAEELLDLQCEPDATTCFRENGSGWFFSMDEDGTPPCADHGYWTGERMDDWRETSDAWGRDANLDWLAGMVVGAAEL